MCHPRALRETVGVSHAANRGMNGEVGDTNGKNLTRRII